jgi:nucleoid-associated protein YgaU
MTQRLILIAIGVVVVLVIVRSATSRPGSGDEVAVDTTGASARNGQPVSARGTPVAVGATPAALNNSATSAGSTATPLVVQVQGTAIAVERKPLVLLNPSTVRQGSSLGVTGSGFDPGATVDVLVKQKETDTGDPITFVQIDKSGGFGGVTFAIPDTLARGSFIVEARQRNSDNVARATAVVAGGSPQIKLGTQAGKAGDAVELSAQGFSPDEDINVYWNAVSGDPIGTLHTDGGGGVRQGTIRVPFGAVGNNGFVFVGDKSQSPVTVAFQLLNMYPDVTLSSYAIKPDTVLSFIGKDFGPGEIVTVYLNNPDGQPLETIQASADGTFENAGGFLVPFGLHGKQTLIFVGQQSKAPTTASFDTLPFTPSAQPSTYGGRPGTTLTFYAVGFARYEVIHALIGRTRDSPGREVSCFMSDAQGNAASGGSYVVPGDAAPGQLIFTLIGSKSEASATAALEVIASDVPVQVPPEAEFQCGLVDIPQAELAAREAAGLPIAAAPAAAAPAAPAPGIPAPAAPAPAAPAPAAPAPTAPAETAAATPPPAGPTAAATPPPAGPTPATKPTAPAKPGATPAAKPGATPAAPLAAQPEPSPTAAAATYTVSDGDTLPAIAQQVYGDASQWRRIYDANKGAIGTNPNLIRAGAQLSIPPKEP